MTMHQATRLIVSALILFPILAAGTDMPAAGNSVEVGIENMKFIPQTIRVKPGGTVKWINREKRTNHSILFLNEGVPESDRLFPGESWSRKFDRPGTYPYVCGPHPEMSGVVEVAE